MHARSLGDLLETAIVAVVRAALIVCVALLSIPRGIGLVFSWAYYRLFSSRMVRAELIDDGTGTGSPSGVRFSVGRRVKTFTPGPALQFAAPTGTAGWLTYRGRRFIHFRPDCRSSDAADQPLSPDGYELNADLVQTLMAADTDDWDEIWDVWRGAQPLAREDVPSISVAYDRSQHWQARAACVYYATAFARTTEAAVVLARKGMRDASDAVRYRAYGLLAYSYRDDSVSAILDLASLQQWDRRYALAAADATMRKRIGLYTRLDDGRAGLAFWDLPVKLPLRASRPEFADEFHSLNGDWLERCGFEPQGIFQHNAFYRRHDVWFQAYWEQWDVLRLFKIGPRSDMLDIGWYVEAMTLDPGTRYEVRKQLESSYPSDIRSALKTIIPPIVEQWETVTPAARRLLSDHQALYPPDEWQ